MAEVCEGAHLAGFGDAFTVFGHGTGYSVQPSSNDPGEDFGSFQLGL